MLREGAKEPDERENWMNRDAKLRIIRAAFAKQILVAAHVDDARLATAFGTVRREHFLGPGPWHVLRWLGQYMLTPDDDPVYLYTNDLVGIVPHRKLNNGQ